MQNKLFIASRFLFTKDNIWVKRPGTGSILAERFEEILGKKASVDIAIDEHLEESQIVNL